MAASEPHVLDKIGSGGLSTVFRADLNGTVVALKVPFQATTDVNTIAFKSMMAALHAVAPPTVPAYRIVQYSGVPCWVSAYHEGVDLVPILATGAIPRKAALEAIAAVASSLTPVAADDLFHGDLKPSNLLVQRDGQIIVLDFGLSLLSAGDKVDEQATAFYGSVGYMAPERLEGKAGKPNDVYSLAAIAYEMLVRERPEKGDTDPTRHGEVVAKRIKALRAVLGSTADPIVALLTAAMQVDKTARPSMAEFATELQALADNAPGIALKPWAKAIVASHLDENEEFPLRNDTVEVARGSVVAITHPRPPINWAPVVLAGTAAALFVAVVVLALT